MADAFTPGDHLSTFGGNPVCCAAALANLSVMQEEQLSAKAAARGEQLLARLSALKASHPVVGDVRGKGLMIGVELVRDAAKTPADAEAKAVRAFCREAAVLVGLGGAFGNVIRFQPPLVISPQQVDRAADVFDAALRAVTGGTGPTATG